MDIRTFDDGDPVGRVILIVHGGMDDGAGWSRVAAQLKSRFRVIRLQRSRYRLDLQRAPLSVADEVADVVAVAERFSHPVLLVGHSSGAVVALEAVAAVPDLFAGLFAYEPPVMINHPFDESAVRAAQDAVTAGKPGRAIAIFERDLFHASRSSALLFRLVVSAIPRLRAYVPRQIDDVAALNHLGLRLSTYAAIGVPTLLASGQRSPDHLKERITELVDLMPRARIGVISRQAHNANDFAPRRLARMIEQFAGEVFIPR